MTVPDFHPEPTDLETSLAFLTSTLADLSEQLPAALDADDSPDVAVLLLAALRAARQELASIENYAEAAAAQRYGKGKHPGPGFLVEVRGGTTRPANWRHDELAFAVTRPIAVDPDTGEVVPEVVDIIDRVRSALLGAARPDWRTGALWSQFGISWRDYADAVPSRRTVTLTADTEAS